MVVICQRANAASGAWLRQNAPIQRCVFARKAFAPNKRHGESGAPARVGGAMAWCSSRRRMHCASGGCLLVHDGAARSFPFATCRRQALQATNGQPICGRSAILVGLAAQPYAPNSGRAFGFIFAAAFCSWVGHDQALVQDRPNPALHPCGSLSLASHQSAGASDCWGAPCAPSSGLVASRATPSPRAYMTDRFCCASASPCSAAWCTSARPASCLEPRPRRRRIRNARLNCARPWFCAAALRYQATACWWSCGTPRAFVVRHTQVVLRVRVALVRRLAVPLGGHLVVLATPSPLSYRNAQVVLGLGQPLVGGLGVPVHRLFKVPARLAVVVRNGQVVLRIGMALFGGFAVQRGGLGVV